MNYQCRQHQQPVCFLCGKHTIIVSDPNIEGSALELCWTCDLFEFMPIYTVMPRELKQKIIEGREKDPGHARRST